MKRSLEIGADYIATGHYARVEKLTSGRFSIRHSVTAAKDQTYALYNLTQEQLSRTLMPVGNIPRIRFGSLRPSWGSAWQKSRTARRSASCPIRIMRVLSRGLRESPQRKGIL